MTAEVRGWGVRLKDWGGVGLKVHLGFKASS